MVETTLYILALGMVLSMVISLFCFPVGASDGLGTTGFRAEYYSQEEILEKILNSPVEHDYSTGIMPRGYTTISSGGTIKAVSLYLQAGQTVTVTVTKNTSSTLLFFYLMNSNGDIVGPKTLDVDEYLFVKPTGYTQLAPQSTGTWGLYIYNDGSTSTSVTYTLSY